MNKKLRIGIVVIAIVAVAMFAGCVEKEEAPPPTPKPSFAISDINVSIIPTVKSYRVSINGTITNMGLGVAKRVSVMVTDSYGEVELGTMYPNTSKPFQIKDTRYPTEMQCINISVLTENLTQTSKRDKIFVGSIYPTEIPKLRDVRLEILDLDVSASSAGDFTSDYLVRVRGKVRNCGNDTALNVEVTSGVHYDSLGDIAPGKKKEFDLVGRENILDIWDTKIVVEAKSAGGAKAYDGRQARHR